MKNIIKMFTKWLRFLGFLLGVSVKIEPTLLVTAKLYTVAFESPNRSMQSVLCEKSTVLLK